MQSASAKWWPAAGLVLAGCVASAAGRPYIVADGNSLTRGSCATTAAMTYPAALEAYGYEVRNAGVGSQTTEGMIETAAENVDAYFRRGSLVIAWEGHNSWRVFAEPAESAYAAMATYVADRHRRGWAVAVMTAIRSDEADQPTGYEGFRAAYNALVEANAAGADMVIRLDDTRLADPDGPYFCGDHVHLSDAGYAVVARLVSNAINIKERSP